MSVEGKKADLAWTSVFGRAAVVSLRNSGSFRFLEKNPLKVGRALRASIAGQFQCVRDRRRLVGRGASRRILACDQKRALAAHGSARSRVHPCSSHSRIAPASRSPLLAQPPIVRKAGRRSFINGIAFAPYNAIRILHGRLAFPAANTTQGFEIVRASAFPCFPRLARARYRVQPAALRRR